MSVVAQCAGRRMITFQKCGHTSVINTFLTPFGQSVVRGAKHESPYYKGFSEEAHSWPDAKVSVVVLRNPLARLASVYNFFIVEQASELKFDVDTEWTFPEFCQHLQTIDLCCDNHVKPQAVSLNEAASGLIHMVQLEQLEEQWPLIVYAFDIPCSNDVAEFNARHYTYDSDHWSAAFVKELYADDYKLWERAYVEARASFPPIRHQAS